jgi:uncharacterized protein (TIGR02300 family)
VANPELGTKRICAGCSVKFYDLNKTPIVCPTCETVFVVPKPAPARPRRVFDAPRQPVAPMAEVPEIAAPATSDDGDATAGVPMLEELDEE